MKRKDLEKRLREKGARLLEHGSKHDRWVGRNGYRFTVPRHAEIKEWLAQAILKQADE